MKVLEQVTGEALCEPGGFQVGPAEVAGRLDANPDLERVVFFHAWFILNGTAGQSFSFFG